MAQKKILIISVSAGAGHVRVAEALKKTAQADISLGDIEVEHIDMMDYVSTPLRKAIVETYDVLVRTIPSLWGYIYEKTNNDNRINTVSKIIKKTNQINCRKFYTFLNTFQPDYIICTHSFPAQVIDQSLQLHHREIPISLVITDFGIHSYWLLHQRATYFVATEKMKWEMIERDISEKHVITSGIPVAPVFSLTKSSHELRIQYKISEDERVILVLSGGQGFMKSDDVLELLLKYTFKFPLRIITIAGKNKKLVKRLKKVADVFQKNNVTVDVVEWTEKIDEYMRIADAVVTKPGGSTTSECISLGKPMVVMNPIPGQEEHNAEYIAQKGYGKIVRTATDLLYYVEEYMGETKKNSESKQKKPAANIILQKVVGDM
jgi:processive 1,2-diacylglycerol beta-glucosyltransferase